MADTFLEYAPDARGYIHNWLVAGPQAIPIPDLRLSGGAPNLSDDDRLGMARRYHKDFFDLHEPPVEYAAFQIDGVDLAWRYLRCAEDHFVDLSGEFQPSNISPTCHYLRAWAYAKVVCPSPASVTCTLTASGAADVWINRGRAYMSGGVPQNLQGVHFTVELREGINEVLVRFETVTVRECPLVMALQIGGLPLHDVVVRLPVDHSNTARRQKLERVYQEAYIERTVILNDEKVVLHWDDQLEEEDQVGFWVQDWRERIKSAGTLDIRPSERIVLGGSVLEPDEGPHAIVLLPPAHVVERSNILYRESLPFHILETPYSQAYYGADQERRREALVYFARREGHLYAEIAKLALGRWGLVDQSVVKQAVIQIDRRQDSCILDLIGLLGVLYRHPGTFAFSTELKQALEACALNFRYWYDEPGSALMDYASESRAILFHVAEVLAGQLYPDRVFASASQNEGGLSGRQHREKGEKLALEWLRERGAKGFVDWDSSVSFEEILLALVHLADWGENQEIAGLASVVMDKVFFTLAVNSYKGVFGSTQGRTEAAAIKGGQLQATSGVARLMWGMGVWNHHLRAVVSLACSNYELPTMIASIAVDLAGEMWHKEHHPCVDKVTYRTVDGMLCSAQSYRPGEKGGREHIWQATLGPDTAVFVNHPACMSESNAQQPNFWRGNGVLPRVAQWKDVLVAIHRLPEDDRLGFTHAYFPACEFDEYRLEDGWAFARKDHGYLALKAAHEFRLIKRGANGFRELRSYGQENIWLCMLGREAADGAFDEFQAHVKALDISLAGLSARCQTLRGDTVSFAWEGPLLVNGQEQPLSGFKHYDGPHCVADWPAEQIDVRYGDYAVRLCFEPLA